jgi:hypothetical protein
MKHLIYALVDPRTEEVRYIGKSSRGLIRPAQHAQPSRLALDDTYRARWLKQLRAEGCTPQIRILEVVDDPDLLNDAEIRWIALGHREDWPLTNLTAGGDGFSFGNQAARGHKHTDEWKAAAAERMRGNKHAAGTVHSDEWKVAAAERMRGNKHALGYRRPPEWIAAQSLRMRGNQYALGRVVPPDELARRTAAIQATYDAWTDEQHVEHARKISEAKQGSEGNIENLKKGWGPEVHARAIAASADARRGAPLPDEQRTAISEGLKRAYAEGRRAPIQSTSCEAMGVWSLEHAHCVECGQTDSPHKGHGQCERCYSRERARELRAAEVAARGPDYVDGRRARHPNSLANLAAPKPSRLGSKDSDETRARKSAAAKLRGNPTLASQGRWSRKYDACTRCGETARPHKGGGLCTRCVQQPSL